MLLGGERVHLFFALIIQFVPSLSGFIDDEFELDRPLATLTCRQCIQFWRALGAAGDSHSYVCGPHSPTCTGNICFMRQCKNCPVYQYISGCLTLTEWQLSELAMARQRAELQATRIGATLLCEDTINQTTCLCNQRNKCNDIHARIPFSTYTGQLFNGIVDFDMAIAKIDPRYSDLIVGKQRLYYINSVDRSRPIFITLCSIVFFLSTYSSGAAFFD